MSIVRLVLCAVVLAGLDLPGSAVAGPKSSGTGGTAVPDDPKVAQAVCEDASAWECSRGAELKLEGEALDSVRQVRFVGGRSASDDRVARPIRTDAHSLEVLVPRAARSGRVAVVSDGGRRALSAKRLKVRAASRRAVTPTAAAPAAPATGEGVFPIAAVPDYGTEINRFGGGRNHKGQDVFAKCGTPLVALFDVTVQFVGSQSAAGNYVVLQGADGQSYAYMHMQGASEVKKGATVRAGRRVGRVGDTGRASGCHLHFEQWTAPGWYEGGKAIDPLPLLRSLEP